MSDIMVYLAMFSITIDKILCFLVCIMSHYWFGLWYPLELGTFLISEDPPPNFELFLTETMCLLDNLADSAICGGLFRGLVKAWYNILDEMGAVN